MSLWIYIFSIFIFRFRFIYFIFVFLRVKGSLDLLGVGSGQEVAVSSGRSVVSIS